MRKSPSRKSQRGWAWLPAAIGAAATVLGGERANSARAAESEENRDFQERMSNTAYQRGMADMKAAGLNPMLAYSQGGASVPTGSMANFENPFASAASAFSAIQSSGAAAESAGASAKQAETASKVGDASVMKIKQEITNLQTDNDKSKAMITVLGEQYQNLVKEGYNLTEVGNSLRATVVKLNAETGLLNSSTFLNVAKEQLTNLQSKTEITRELLNRLDIDAAGAFDNLGKTAGQLEPFFRILRLLLSGRGR